MTSAFSCISSDKSLFDSFQLSLQICTLPDWKIMLVCLAEWFVRLRSDKYVGCDRFGVEFGFRWDRFGIEFGLSCDRSGVKFGLNCDRFRVEFGLSCDRSGGEFGLSCDRWWQQQTIGVAGNEKISLFPVKRNIDDACAIWSIAFGYTSLGELYRWPRSFRQGGEGVMY